MKKMKMLLIAVLILVAAGAAKATKARDLLGYIYINGAYMQVYVPYECNFNGYGCIYTSGNGYQFQVYLRDGLYYYPIRP
jgi:hypothetical protein